MNNSHVGWNIDFKKDQQYFYTTKLHQETEMIIYFVSDGEINELFEGVPFVESKFKKLFNNQQEDRHEKINKILND